MGSLGKLMLGNLYNKRSSRTLACRILPGALITLSDAKQKDSTNSNKPRRREFLLPKLVGFLYAYWAASSRSRGCVELESILTNRLTGCGTYRDEYEAVEIEAIEQTKEITLDRVYSLTLPRDEQTLHIYGYLVDTNALGHTLRQTINMLRKVPGSRRLGVLSYCKEIWPMFKKFDSQCINQRLNWEPIGVAINYIARGFSLTAHYPSRFPDRYELPTLSLVDSYLLVQDKVYLRSIYDSKDRRFRWIRELKQ
ncbi:hypothetical protein N7527_005298 [Penicillium freii]|nr:hypothetical protein N7527_005298 [Penicillium freii]